ncbi:GNAT family N-acetyltransferase [Alteromonas sp. ASW11-130]|uniref:GNAT family N-acetyltransferase n=1 Tax=Alteromonas sp. ASW11-130 TaxID=3015775 RepID=UPI002241FC5D|nr:GNAT family protein [Alteromonas sp. ASW11-130]MCW8091999.1 GNAT family N-acetyltransferase [Alteromonas sp. ASW11-130]
MILLRDFTENDYERLVTNLNDVSITRFLSSKIPSPYTMEDAEWWVNTGSRNNLIKAISFNGILVGCIGVNGGGFEYQRSGEIGYWLAKEYWRKGIASVAIRRMSEYVFSNTNIVRIFGSVFSGNEASMQLLLKSGFKQEAILENAIFKNGRYFDNHIFTKLKE